MRGQLLQKARGLALDIVGDQALRKLRARRRGSAFRDAGIVFIHVPKAAGTSIANQIYGRFIGHFGIADVIAANQATVLGLPRFSVIRNPWDRLVSAWSFARDGSGSGGAIKVGMHRPDRYAGPDFQDFERFVLDWLPGQPFHALDGVFQDQSSYLLDARGQLAVDHIGRLERLPETEQWVSDKLGREVRFARGNTSRHEDYRSYYTPQTIDAVAAFYARDIALFGCEFDPA